MNLNIIYFYIIYYLFYIIIIIDFSTHCYRILQINNFILPFTKKHYIRNMIFIILI